MLSISRTKSKELLQAGLALPASVRTTSTSRNYYALRHYSPGLVNSTRQSLILQSALRPQSTVATIPTRTSATLNRNSMILQQHRSISFWNNIPLALMKASPLQRRLALVGLGGASLAVLVILGPFLLVGLGGIAAVMGFRFWRFRNQLIKQANGSGINDWPDFLNAFIQQQQGGVFGQDQTKVETEAIKRLEMWSQTEQARNRLIEYGVYPNTLTQNVSMRGSSFASTTVNGITMQEIKIELELTNSPGSVLIATAQLDKEGNMTMTDMKLVTPTRHVLRVPLSIQNIRGGSRGRVIEGEFHDVQ